MVANAGFETGNVTGWIASPAPGGAVSVVSSFGYADGCGDTFLGQTWAPVDGSSFALLNAGSAAGGNYTILDQAVRVTAGSTISGLAFLCSSETYANNTAPFDDDAEIAIRKSGVDTAVVYRDHARAELPCGYTGSIPIPGQTVCSGLGNPAWALQWSYTFPSTGTYTVEARVENVGDALLPTWLGVDAVRLVSAQTFAPLSGITGSTVTITGTDLGGATAVDFAGLAARFMVLSPTQVRVTVPVGASSGRIAVTTPDGIATSQYGYAVTLSIWTRSPAKAAPGSSVTLTGVGFANASAVAFAGTPAQFTILSDGRISTIVPAGATSGPITVTTPLGTVRSKKFTVA